MREADHIIHAGLGVVAGRAGVDIAVGHQRGLIVTQGVVAVANFDFKRDGIVRNRLFYDLK